MASPLFLFPDQGQRHPHHTLQVLPLTSQHSCILRRGEDTRALGSCDTVSPRSPTPALGGWLSKNPGSSLPLHPPSALRGSSTLPRMTRLPQTWQVSLPLSSCHHLAFPCRTGCRTGSRFVTSPSPDGTETKTHSPFPFKGLYN